MKNLKYITWETPDGIPAFVLFPQHLQHRDIWSGIRQICALTTDARPVGAGFAKVDVEDDSEDPDESNRWQGKYGTFPTTFEPFGRSDSLNLGVHPSDHETLNTQPL